MGMSVFNRPQAGACPVCGAPMYYRQAPILLEHDFEQYDVWASVRYCEDCGIEIMVPGEAKIARHSARYAVEKDIRAKEAAARSAAQVKPRKEHSFLPKEEIANAKTKNAPVRLVAEEKEKRTIPEAMPKKDQVPGPERKASASQTPVKQAEPANGKFQEPEKDPVKHPETAKKYPFEQKNPRDQKNRGPEKREPEQTGRKDPGKQNQPKQSRNGQNSGGILQTLRDRMSIDRANPGELPITRGRFGMSDLNLTSSAAKNISSLLDMTETREMIEEKGVEAASNLTAQNVDEYIAEELSIEPQIDRRDKRKNRGQDGRRPERANAPKAGEQPSADAGKDRGFKEQPKVKNNADGKSVAGQSANTKNQDTKGTKNVREMRQNQDLAKNTQVPGQNGQQERRSQNGKIPETERNSKNADSQRPQPNAGREKGNGPVTQVDQSQKSTDSRNENKAPGINKAPKQKEQSSGPVTPTTPNPQAAGTKNQTPKQEQTKAPATDQKPEPEKRTEKGSEPGTKGAANQTTGPEKTEPKQKNADAGTESPVTVKEQEQTKTAPNPQAKEQAATKEPTAVEKNAKTADGKEDAEKPSEPEKGMENPKTAEQKLEGQTGKTDAEKTSGQENPQESEDTANGTEENTKDASSQEEEQRPDLIEFRKTIARHLPAWVVSKIPFLADAVNMPTDTPISVEKDFVKRYQAPHCKEIVDDLLYDTDTSEMFLRKESSYGFDRPCLRFNYRSQNGHFFCCSVRYDRHNKNGHVELRPMDTEMEVKPMLRRYPELYKRFFDGDLKNA